MKYGVRIPKIHSTSKFIQLVENQVTKKQTQKTFVQYDDGGGEKDYLFVQ